MANCVRCGKPIPATENGNRKYCRICAHEAQLARMREYYHARLAKKNPEAVKHVPRTTCIMCGAPIIQSTNGLKIYCAACGELKRHPERPAKAKADKASPAKARAKGKAKAETCSGCGAPIDPADNPYGRTHLCAACRDKRISDSKNKSKSESLASGSWSMRKRALARQAAHEEAKRRAGRDAVVATRMDADTGCRVQWRGQMCGGGSSAKFRHQTL